jgi:hypothetical protein
MALWEIDTLLKWKIVGFHVATVRVRRITSTGVKERGHPISAIRLLYAPNLTIAEDLKTRREKYRTMMGLKRRQEDE